MQMDVVPLEMDMPASVRPRSARFATCVLLAACTREDLSSPIVSVRAEPTTVSQVTLSAELSEPTRAAAACVRQDDPSEVHLLEAEGDGQIDFRFSGLLAATDYDCTVASTSTEGETRTVSFRTPDPPDPFPSADVVSDDLSAMTGTYTVTNARSECRSAQENYVTVLDPEGNNRWLYLLPSGMNIGVEVVPDGPNRFLWGGGKRWYGAPTIVDVLDDQVWKLDFAGIEDSEFHHEVNRIEDGRILSVDDTYEPGWAAFRMRLSDEDGGTSWLWDVQSAVASGWLPPGDADNDDPHHLNWADVVQTPRGLEAFASLCFSFLVVAIDVESGEPLWKFGYGGDFELTDSEGHVLADQSDFPQCQHGLDTDGTRLLMYDNGFDRGYTRAVEYELDLQNKTARKTWEWLDEGYWEKYHGSTEWLTPERDRVLVAQGNNDCGAVSSRHSQIVEVDRNTDKPVHRLIMRDIGHWIYRAHRVDGCKVFSNAKYCPDLADRLEELRPTLGL
jgi:hypothetical protein